MTYQKNKDDIFLFDKYILIMDVDGTLTTSHMYYDKEGKKLKSFGPDDFDLIKVVKKFFDVCVITGDSKGFEISRKRMVDEMNLELHFVSGGAKERREWIKQRAENKYVFFIGDGWADYLCLRECDYGITFPDTLDHVKSSAKFVTNHTGGNRGVAEAIFHIMKKLNVDVLEYA